LVRRGSEVNKSQRYRLIVTGARGSGISSLVQLMARRDELKSHQGKDLLPSKTRGRCQKMPWKCWKNYLNMWLYIYVCVCWVVLICVYSISRLSCSQWPNVHPMTESGVLRSCGMMGSWPPGALGALPALDLYQRMDLERSQLSGNTSTYLNISRHTVYIYICVCDHIYIHISGLWTWESQGVLGQISSVRTCHWWTSQQSWTIRNCPSRQSTSAPLLSSHRCPARHGTFFRSYMGWEIPELL